MREKLPLTLSTIKRENTTYNLNVVNFAFDQERPVRVMIEAIVQQPCDTYIDLIDVEEILSELILKMLEEKGTK